LRVNREIRAPKVRVVGSSGEQVGIMSSRDAMKLAEDEGLDLVEIAPNATPPVCKIIDYGKFRYDQTKREKESKKASHQVKVKEVKVKPNINEHDLQTKMRHAKDFLDKGCKVKVTCMFRGREMAHKDIGERLIHKILEELNEVAVCETPMKMFGRFLTVVLAPHKNKK
jgi:translation initiation factor IF-3